MAKDIVSADAEEGQIIDVVDIEGIGPKYAKELKKVGIKNSEELRKSSLVEVVEATKLSPKLVYRWQCLADLARLKRVAEEYSDLLFEANIETVSEVARQKADDLYDDVMKAAEEAKKKGGWAGDVKKPPTEKDIEIWIESAKELVKKGKQVTDSTIKAALDGVAASKPPATAQVGKVIDIEGIGPKYADKLKEVGIETTEQLRKAPIVEIVEATDISPKHIYKWVCMADLFRLKRVAEEYSGLLFFAEIETVSEVAKQKAKDLHGRIKRAAEDAAAKGGWSGDVNKIPGVNDIKTWISSAKELMKK
jgi:predicted flap endonuclease-1-like 5' DNA nuclease